MKKALFIMIDTLVHEVYDEEAQKIIHENFDVIGDPLTKENYLEQKELLAEVEVIFLAGAPLLSIKNFWKLLQI